MAGEHHVRTTSWITVALVIIASTMLGFALPLHSLPLAIAGGVLLLVGLVMGGVYGIMDDAY